MTTDNDLMLAEFEVWNNSFDHREFTRNEILKMCWQAAINSIQKVESEPFAWMLKTGHGIKIVENKPDCEIDLWVPLYTIPQDQTDSSEGNIKEEIV